MKICIAILDDDADVLLHISHLVRQWAAERGVSARVCEYNSAEDYLFAEEVAEILLLDVEMRAMSGIDLAKRLRAGHSPAQIVFITGYPDYIAEGYEVQALHYLIKPVAQEKLFAVLDRAAANLQASRPAILLEAAGGPIRFYIDEILCLESRAHHTICTTKSGAHELLSPISELETRLRKDFVRCHRSYLVNLRCIAQLTRTDVILDDGQRLPLSRRLGDEVRRRFIAYYRRDADAPV